MEKILLLQHPLNPTAGALDFACYLATLTNSKITGIFLEDIGGDEQLAVQKLATAELNPWPVSKPIKKLADNIKSVDNNVSNFQQACERRSTRHSVHIHQGNPSKEIIRESRYADLLVLDAETTLSNHLRKCRHLFSLIF